MSNYLLLRDNKQSGPYSMEELRSKGLKPYDLVWIDGKSAAWRYPSEVEELKSFAPVVEEQPFDRFFKKPSPVPVSSSDAATENPIAVKENFSSPVIKKPEPLEVSSAATSPSRRIIYVTMPGNISKNSRDERVRNEIVPDERVKEERVREEKVAAFSGIQIPNHRSVEENFPQESGHDPHHFVEKRPQFINQAVSGRKMRPFAIGLSVIALLAAGVLIGVSINGHSRGFDHSSAAREELAADRPQDHSASPLSVFTSVAGNPMQKNGNLSNPVISDPVPSQNSKTGGEGIPKKKATSSKEKLTAAQQQKMSNDASASAKDSALALLAQPHRDASHKTDESPDKEAIKNSVIDQVSVSFNKYNTGTFGGISELQLTVSNSSIYPLDLVVVEVRYIQSNKKVYKTENLYFRGIRAGSGLTQEAPKSARGIKIVSRIIIINSKELGLSYSGI